MKKINIIQGLLILFVIANLSVYSQQVDTTGIGDWKKMYNSTASWEDGAFSFNQTEHPDYGWGIYNMLTHGLKADSFNVIKLLSGDYKKLLIEEKNSVANKYMVKFADLDGSNEVSTEINCGDYISMNFINYSLSEAMIVENEPASDSWDLVLTKFHHQELSYVVTGFLANEGVMVSVFNASDSLTAANATLADTTMFSDSIAAIGNSWNSFAGMAIVPLDTMVYFVKQANGDIYKLQTTFFESGYSGLGRLGIRTQLLGETPGDIVNDTLVMGAFYANEVYFNLAGGDHHMAERDNWDISFRTAQFSSSIRANIAAGVELYTYPGGIDEWDQPGSLSDLQKDGSGLQVYPSPATEDLYVSWKESRNNPYQIRIFDITGKIVLEHSATRQQAFTPVHLDLSEINTGLYIIQVISSKDTREQRLLIK